MAYLGFSVLLFVKPESRLLQGLTPTSEAYKELERTLLKDAQLLLGCRWTMDFTFLDLDGVCYVHGNNNRFTVSNSTIDKALGDLVEHVGYIRSTATITANDLIEYKKARERWNVQDSDTSGGMAGPEQPGTSTDFKRKRI